MRNSPCWKLGGFSTVQERLLMAKSHPPRLVMRMTDDVTILQIVGSPQSGKKIRAQITLQGRAGRGELEPAITEAVSMAGLDYRGATETRA